MNDYQVHPSVNTLPSCRPNLVSRLATARIFWTLLLPLCIASSGAAVPPSWQERLSEVIDRPRYQQARWGLMVADLKTGEVLYERDADKLFAPASVTKLYSVAAALQALGPGYRFDTLVLARGSIDSQGSLQGDLILVASGDPTLGGRTDAQGHIVFKDNDHIYANGGESGELTAPDPLAGLNALAHQVVGKGVRRVQGEVLIDDRLFEPAEGSGSGPSRLTPIVVNDNLVDIVITPAAQDAKASVHWRPESAALQVDAQVETVATNQNLRITVKTPSPGRIIVRGQIPAGHKPLLRVAEVDDPASFARALFIEALRRAGVWVDASPLAANRSDLLPPSQDEHLPGLASFRSPPFQEEARLILKVSHNLHASLLPLVLAAHQGKRTLSDGLQIERGLVGRLGVEVSTISFAGGAGGSRADYTTPRATIQLLRGMANRPEFDAYKAGLPVLGVDGTLSHAVDASSPARGRVFAKTGTLLYDNLLNDDYLLTSKALAGYMTTRHGRDLALAVFLNNLPLPQPGSTSEEGKALGKVCEILYEEL
jgi:D-alanyl-D-alanine carboxypeptidase/D-alanyl-D-alanine-endopeptidase (penicillin-binding protein 4)